MKKGVKKLRLHRETLINLTEEGLGTALGGLSAGTRCATDCDGCTDTRTQCSRVCP